MSITRKYTGDSVGGADNAFNTQAAQITSSATGGRSPRLQFAQIAATSCFANWSALGDTGGWATRFYVEFSAAPSAEFKFIEPQNASNVRAAAIGLSTALKLRLRDSANTQRAESTAALSTGTVYRIELTCNGDTTATLRYFLGDSTTLIEELTYTGAAATFSTLNNFRIGNAATTPTAPTYYVDDLAVDNTATFIGPAVVVLASAGADQIDLEPYATVTLDGSASTGVTSYAWTQTAGSPTVTLTGDTTASPTFPAPGTLAGTTLTFQLSVNSGASTDTMTATVLPVSERAVLSGAEVPMQPTFIGAP